MKLLLAAYPPGPRRDEVAGTLAECGPQGLRGSVNLLAHGLRARLGRPDSTGIVVLAVLFALVCGSLVSAGATRLAWETAPALPSGAAVDEITSTLLPGLKVWGGGDSPVFEPEPDGDGGWLRGTDFYWAKPTAATKDVQHYAEGARDRLAAAGWDIRSEVTPIIEPDLVTPTDESTFWAVKDGLILDFHNLYWHDRAWYDSEGGPTFTLARDTPPWVEAAAVLGGVLGGLGGWLLLGWMSRRTPEHPGAVAATWMFTAVMLPGTALVALGTFWVQEEPPGPGMWSYYLWPLGGLVLFAALFLVIALASAVLTRPLPAAWKSKRTYAVAAAVLLIATDVVLRPAAAAPARPCTPTGLPADPPANVARTSHTAYVFVATTTNADQANLINAAIFRVMGAGSGEYHRDATVPDFSRPYCGDTRLPVAVAEKLPWYFIVPVNSPSDYDAMVAEVTGMPGVLATRHAWPEVQI